MGGAVVPPDVQAVHAVLAQRRAPRRAVSGRLTGGLFLAAALGSAYNAGVLIPFAGNVGVVYPWAMPPLSAVTLGALYAGAVAMAGLCGAAARWESVRASVLPVVLVVAAVPAMFLREVGSTNLLGGPVFGAVSAWLWLLTHAGLVLGAVVGLVAQRRERGPVPRPAAPLPRAVAATLLGFAALLAVVGLALVVRPDEAGWWPWHLGRLDAEVVGVWCLALALGAVGSAREADLWRSAPPLAAVAVTGLLALSGALWFHGGLRSGPASVVYVVVVVVTAVAGIVLLALGGPPREREP